MEVAIDIYGTGCISSLAFPSITFSSPCPSRQCRHAHPSLTVRPDPPHSVAPVISFQTALLAPTSHTRLAELPPRVQISASTHQVRLPQALARAKKLITSRSRHNEI